MAETLSAIANLRIVERNTLVNYSLWALLPLLPPLLLLLLSLLSGNNCFAGNPTWPDELEYWRHVYSLSSTEDGSFGYYGTVGYPAEIGQLGWHGLSSVLVYGIPALLFGWELNSIVIFNMLFCMAAFLAFSLLVKPTTAQCACIAVLWLCYVPIILFSPTSWMEMPHYAGLILYVALLVSIARRKNCPANIVWLSFFIVFGLSILRITNVVFYLPLVLALSQHRHAKRFLLFSLLALFLTFLSWWFFGLFSSPYPNNFLTQLLNAPGFTEKLNLLQANIVSNLWHFVSFSENLISDCQRYSILVMLAFWLALLIGFKIKEKNDGKQKTCRRDFEVTILCLLTMLFSVIAVVAIYDVHSWRDYRIWAPTFWCLLLLCVVGYRHKALAITPAAFVVVPLIVCLSAIPETNVPRAFEWSRYQPVELSPSEEPASLVKPLGAYPEDKTIVIEEWGMKGPFTPLELDPSMGILLHHRTYDYEGCNLAYIFSKTEIEELAGYSIIWKSKEGILYRRD